MSKVVAPKSAEKTRPQYMRTVATKLGLTIDPNAKPLDVASAIANHYTAECKAGRIKSAGIGTCDACGGDSPLNLDACPYCATQEDGKVDPVALTIDEGAFKTEKPATAKKGAKAAKAEAPAPEVPAVVEPKKTAKKSAAAPATTTAPNGQTLVKTTPKPAGDLVVPDAPELDAVVHKVQELKAAAAVDYWRLGILIKDIHDRQVYKQRLNVKGKEVHASFRAFVVAELGLMPDQAYVMMDVAAKYSQEDIAKFGTTKLHLLLKAPEADQPSLKQDLEKGITKRDLAEKVKGKRHEAGVTKRDTGRKAMPTGKTPVKVAKPKAGMITVASIEGRRTVKLFAKAKSDKRASRIADEPVCEFDLQPGVKQYVSLQAREDGWVLVIVTKRVDD